MRYALVDRQRQDARSGLSGQCPCCGAPMVAKCGEIKIWHWAHRGRRTCDVWWENEGEWHRDWKGQFPADWQEVVLLAKSGEKHIADVRTDQGWFLEFQHSYLKPEERRAREAFYRKQIWVVDGARRKRDKSQFFQALKEGLGVSANPTMLRVYSHGCALLREWANSRVPVVFDFGESQRVDEAALWCLLPWHPNEAMYVVALSRAGFVRLLRHSNEWTNADQGFVGILKELGSIISAEIKCRRDQELRHRALSLNRLTPRIGYGRRRRPESFQQYYARKQRNRRRF